jgi:diguanylate cyclase (GGDEF)-like protein
MSTSLRALIIEDSLTDLELLLNYLRESGYELVFDRVETAEAMQAALERQAWDVAISDHVMPRFSAPAALAILKERDRDLPFIIVSGGIGEEAAVALMKAGAHDYILKDNLIRLAPAIEREMREAQNRQAHRRAQAEIRQLNAALEQRVNERTEQLIAANQELRARVSELEQRDRESRLLGEMGDLLQACRTLSEAYDTIARSCRQLFPALSGALYIIRPSRDLVEAFAAWGESSADLAMTVFAPDECWALRRGRAYTVEDARLGPVCQHADGPYMCVPMLAQGEALGVLHMQRQAQTAGAPGHLSELERLATVVAEHLALALSNLNLRETLRSQAIRDPLTNLFNRRYMEESLERELRRVRRKQAPLSIIMLDIDHFKRFNDNFGHDGGDALLRQLAALLQSSVRAEDIACRYGGEEFILIMPEAPLAVAQHRAEMLREKVKETQVEYLGSWLEPITLSLGLAACPEHGSTGEALIRAADVALYRAKREGRDQLAVGP